MKLRTCVVGTATECADAIAALDTLFAVTWTTPFSPGRGTPLLGRRWADAQAIWSTDERRSAADSALLVDLDSLGLAAGEP